MVKASDNTPKRNPFCSRCRNHGKKAQVKGHKRHCEYKDCKCGGCALVEARQYISAAQIRRRRYQKQDEECGRRIEVSPPVLNPTSQDPAAILTGRLLRQIPHRQRSNLVVNEEAPSIPAPALLPSERLHPQQPHLPHQHLHQHQQHLSEQHQQSPAHQPHLQQGGSSNSQAVAAAAAAGLATPLSLSNALHLFQFHNPSYSPLAAPSVPASTVSSAAVAAAAAAATVAPVSQSIPQWPRPPPNVCEQMQIVTDIYNSYGPLAIYSWLRAEHFNLAKIHYLIELSRAPYTDLLDLKYKSSTSNEIINRSNNNHNTDNHNSSSSSNTNSSNDSTNTTYEISTTSDHHHRHMTFNLTRTSTNRSSTHLN